MILVDTSVWADHLGKKDRVLSGLLEEGEVLVHPFVIGEIAMGNLPNRRIVLAMLGNLPQAAIAMHTEVMDFIEKHSMAGMGIGYVDAHLLASAKLTPQCLLWSRDKRLDAAALKLGSAYRAV
jgi:predicted nucleic acid-binding protein